MSLKGIHPDSDMSEIYEIIEGIIKEHSSVNSRGYHRMTPLHYAAHIAAGFYLEDIKPVIEGLLALGANVNAKDSDGKTPLDHLSKHHKELLPLLSGEDTDMTDALFEVISSGWGRFKDEEIPTCKTVFESIPNFGKYENTEKHNYLPIHSAAYYGNLTALQFMVQHDYDIARESKYGDQAIHIAASQGNPRSIELLLNAGADVDAIDKHKRTALHHAVGCESHGDPVQTSDALIKAKANTCLIDEDGDTPLHLAVHYDLKVVRTFLANNCPVNVLDGDGETPLFTAVILKKSDIALILLQSGAAIDHKNKNGETALMWATIEPDCVKVLIDNVADVNQTDNDGNTPIHWCSVFACEGLNVEVITESLMLLIKAGANLNTKNNEGKTFADIANTCKPKSQHADNLAQFQLFVSKLQNDDR
jgi:ankyrin repeat protein